MVLNSGRTVSLCLNCVVYMEPTVYWPVLAQGHGPHYTEIRCFRYIMLQTRSFNHHPQWLPFYPAQIISTG